MSPFGKKLNFAPKYLCCHYKGLSGSHLGENCEENLADNLIFKSCRFILENHVG